MRRFSAPCEERITAVFSPGNSVSDGTETTSFLGSAFLDSVVGCGLAVSTAGFSAAGVGPACGTEAAASVDAGVGLGELAVAGIALASEAGAALPDAGWTS